MIVLGFDTATPSTTVGLRLSDGSLSQARDDPAPGEHPGHATRLLAMAGELLAGAGVAWGALERIAVGVGPGTFTGLRVGIATARGLAQSLSVELVGVSSLQALALAAGADGHEAVLAVLDARRGEVFAAAYAATEGRAPQELSPARALAPEDLQSVLKEAARDGGEDRQPWIAVGDGAIRYRDHLELAGVTVAADSSPLHFIGAAAICELGASAPAAGCEQIVPDYRRRADAEIALEGAGVVEAGAS
jgi:tRNA threonylcarbamoyladenosine biosynthesis protein TsaB